MRCNAIQVALISEAPTQTIPVSAAASAPAVVPPPTPARAVAPSTKQAPAGTTPAAPPAGSAKAAAEASAPSVAAGGSAAPAAPGVGEAKVGDTPADAAAAAVPPRKEYAVVGGPVSGVAEIVLTGVKGDPEEVIKKIRRRGFMIHLVSGGLESFACAPAVREAVSYALSRHYNNSKQSRIDLGCTCFVCTLTRFVVLVCQQFVCYAVFFGSRLCSTTRQCRRQ